MADVNATSGSTVPSTNSSALDNAAVAAVQQSTEQSLAIQTELFLITNDHQTGRAILHAQEKAQEVVNNDALNRVDNASSASNKASNSMARFGQ